MSWIRVRYKDRDIKDTIALFDKIIEYAEKINELDHILINNNDDILVSFDIWRDIAKMFSDCDYIDEYLNDDKVFDFLNKPWTKEFNTSVLFYGLNNFIGKDSRYYYVMSNYYRGGTQSISRTSTALELINNHHENQTIFYTNFNIYEFGSFYYSSNRIVELSEIILRRFSNKLEKTDKELLEEIVKKRNTNAYKSSNFTWKYD